MPNLKFGTLYLLLVMLLAFSTVSCVSRKKLSYFQNLPNKDVTFTPPLTPYRLQTGDVLKVAYTGPDPAALAPFGSEASTTTSPSVSNLQVYLMGYSVSDSGSIFLPGLGKIMAGNHTLEEVEKEIQVKLNTLVRNATAKVRLVSFKISILGEVRTPGTYYIYHERLTIPEALGYASDMTDNADRHELKLIRRKQGVVTITSIDMTDPAILGSPTFYLQPNDVLYAVPIAQKADRLNLPVVAVGISGFTAFLVLLSLLVR